MPGLNEGEVAINLESRANRPAGRNPEKTPDCMISMPKRRSTPQPKIDEKKYEDWQKSWKPGDPIPKEYRQREKSRRRAFP